MILRPKEIATLFVSGVALTVTILVFFLGHEPGYGLLFFHPLVYAVCYVLVLRRAVTKSYARSFITVFTVIGAVRFVLLPLMTVLSGHFYGRSHVDPLPQSFMAASILMLWELVLCTAFIAVKEKQSRRLLPQALSLEKTLNPGYWVFGLAVILLALAVPQAVMNISFVKPRALSSDISEASALVNFTAYALLVVKSLAFVIVVRTLARKYHKSRSELWVLLATSVAILNVSIYWGGSRSDILIPGIASALLLYKLFGKPVRKYFALGLAVIVLATTLVTVERETQTYSRGASPLVDVADTLQVYVGGPYNVAIAIETKDYFPESSRLSVLMMDIFRPMIGFNFLLKNAPYVYSNVHFNNRLWTHVERRSQIIPMVGQGYVHFGFFLAPLLTLAFLWLGYALSEVRARTISPEVFYFVTLVVIRMGFMMGQNSMNMINDLSMNLFLFIGVFYANKFIVRLIRK